MSLKLRLLSDRVYTVYNKDVDNGASQAEVYWHENTMQWVLGEIYHDDYHMEARELIEIADLLRALNHIMPMG